MSDAGPDACSCSALRQATRHVTRLYDVALAPVGLGLNQYAVLAKLDRHGPQVLQALADLLVMDRSSLGHLLRPLRERGLVDLVIPPTDRRQRMIVLTGAGTGLMAKAKPCWADAERHFETVFGAEASLRLRTLLKQVATLEFRP